KRKTEPGVELPQLLPAGALLRCFSAQRGARVEGKISQLAVPKILEDRRIQVDVGELHGRAFRKRPKEGKDPRRFFQKYDLITSHLDGLDQQIVEILQQQVHIRIPGNRLNKPLNLVVVFKTVTQYSPFQGVAAHAEEPGKQV